jgi:hypothetical protein
MESFDTHVAPAPQPSRPYVQYIGQVKYIDRNVYIDASGHKVTQSKTYVISLYDHNGVINKHYNNHVGFHVDFIV